MQTGIADAWWKIYVDTSRIGGEMKTWRRFLCFIGLHDWEVIECERCEEAGFKHLVCKRCEEEDKCY